MAKKKATLPKKSHLNSGIDRTEKAPGLRIEGSIEEGVMVEHP
ncbi:MAG: hypothetical protein VCA12_11075 [Pseudomonadales bacterium]|jgi:hypothetical protein|tara:strand:+ start:1177 stop:1305 length:129 start_codon:yes stop_codon:yes gene_type:complete